MTENEREHANAIYEYLKTEAQYIENLVNPTGIDEVAKKMRIIELYEDFKWVKLDESEAKNMAQMIRL